MEIKEGELIMGVVNGNGNLFVKGDYDSITVLQQKLLELEELRRGSRAEELEDEIKELKKTIKQLNYDKTDLQSEISALHAELFIARNTTKREENPTPFAPNPSGPIWCKTSETTQEML